MSESIVQRAEGSARPRAAIPAFLAVALAAALAAWGTFGESHPETWEYLIILGFIAVATAVVFGWAVPQGLRRESAGPRALVLSVLGFLAIAIFWSGLPPILAMGGMVLGWAGRNAERGAWLCRGALALGALAIAADIAVYIQDMAF
jgi:hypothetical protein